MVDIVDLHSLPASSDIQAAVEQLHSGGLIAFPTDTIYGLGADASNPTALAKIYQLKNRPADKPFVILFESLKQIKKCVTTMPIAGQKLAQHFWPGPLTLILPSEDGAIGVRIPNHPIALQLLKQFGKGIATTSVNRSGEKSLLTTESIQTELGDEIDYIVAGACSLGIESTIVDLTAKDLQILRVGAISETAIYAALK